MQSIFICEKKFENFKRITAQNNEESKIYVDKDSLYKIYYSLGLRKFKEKRIEKLSLYSHPNCIFPRKKIVDKWNRFIGIEEEFLKNYITLRNKLLLNDLDYEDRLLISHQLCKTSKDLEHMGISFIDIHLDNIMILDNIIKFIDLDSCEFISKTVNSDVFEYIRKDLISRYLAEVCFFTLYGKAFNIFELDRESVNNLLKIANEKQRKILYKIFLKGETIDIENYLDSFDEDFIEQSKLILKQ